MVPRSCEPLHYSSHHSPLSLLISGRILSNVQLSGSQSAVILSDLFNQSPLLCHLPLLAHFKKMVHFDKNVSQPRFILTYGWHKRSYVFPSSCYVKTWLFEFILSFDFSHTWCTDDGSEMLSHYTPGQSSFVYQVFKGIWGCSPGEISLFCTWTAWEKTLLLSLSVLVLRLQYFFLTRNSLWSGGLGL